MPRSLSREVRRIEGDRLKKLREKMGVGQREMACEFRCASGAISQWETGKRTIPGPVLRLMEAYESGWRPKMQSSKNDDIVQEVRRARQESAKRQAADPEKWQMEVNELAKKLELKGSKLKPRKIDLSKLDKKRSRSKA